MKLPLGKMISLVMMVVIYGLGTLAINLTDNLKVTRSMNSIKFKTIDEYHSSFPPTVREKLEVLRNSIRQAAPKAEEIISYNMPAFRGIVSYGGFKNHIGFFPGALAIALFKNDLTKFKTSKGTIQLPLGSRLPIGLIKKIVKFRVKEYAKKLKTKK